MKIKFLTKSIARVIVITLLMAGSAYAQDVPINKEDIPVKEKEYSPYVDQHIPQNVYFGDTHHHSSYSFDAGMLGNTQDPETSYRFARGEEVIALNGMKAKLNRPLDFLVVSDHASYLGLTGLMANSDPRLMATKSGRELVESMNGTPEEVWIFIVSMMKDFETGIPRINDPEVTRSVWESVVNIASKYNEPGKFTAFNGYEWTSAPGGDNLHRNVIFRDGPERVKQIVPFSAFDSNYPEDLWDFLADYEKKTGGQVLAIPHNGNISNGVMYAETMSNGNPMTKAYAEMRNRWEPLMEITQTKGDSEAHPFLSAEDEFADFETWDFGNAGTPMTDKKTDMLQYEYARSALKWGLKHEANLGFNPFKYGFVGGTDNHVSLSTTREENYFGKLPAIMPGPDRANEAMIKRADGSAGVYSWETGASGLTGVWANENTRESLWDAMARKEVYATTGTRMTVRVFAGWDFKAEEVQRSDFAKQGYKRGVPMGGDLFKAPKGKIPTFMVRALRDPDGANLDRIQIIKGWLDKNGETQERIYDVAVSDDRKIDSNGRCKTSVGNTVDIRNASFENSIGEAFLMGYWKDPNFDPKLNAFYYVRVIEIPTPRWTAYDAKRFNVKMAKEVRMTVEERAYASPIWYNPNK